MIGVDPPPPPRDEPPLTPAQAAERQKRVDAAMQKQISSFSGV
jgi:hypothetical protein